MWEKGELATTSAEEEKKQNFFYFHLPSLDPNLLLRRRIERDSTKATLKRSGTQQSQLLCSAAKPLRVANSTSWRIYYRQGQGQADGSTGLAEHLREEDSPVSRLRLSCAESAHPTRKKKLARWVERARRGGTKLRGGKGGFSFTPERIPQMVVLLEEEEEEWAPQNIRPDASVAPAPGEAATTTTRAMLPTIYRIWGHPSHPIGGRLIRKTFPPLLLTPLSLPLSISLSHSCPRYNKVDAGGGNVVHIQRFLHPFV